MLPVNDVLAISKHFREDNSDKSTVMFPTNPVPSKSMFSVIVRRIGGEGTCSILRQGGMFAYLGCLMQTIEVGLSLPSRRF
eukprot:scaffold66_cov115-Cylindrotheca_fusiformis.AAC.2